MTEIYIPKDKFSELVSELISRFRVTGPVFQGQYHEFRDLERADELDLQFQNTRLSPKELFQPQSELMFEYSTKRGDPEANILKEPTKDYSRRVVLGIRPCDARALQLVDINFDTDEYRDPWWVRRREATTLVGLGCNNPCATCFCTAVGTGPFDPAGLDVLLVDVDAGYVAKSCTEKGEALLADVKAGQSVPREAEEQASRLRESSAAAVSKPFDVAPLSDKAMNELFDSPFWDEVQFSCINCGTCTFLCPTCWCFDIQDEVHKDQGVRLRNWDSCMFPLFTLHGSGHNPRQQKLQRVRQRFMHKFKYYIDKYGDGPACVGCGRCVRFCPVNIDIRTVVSLMSARCVCPA